MNQENVQITIKITNEYYVQGYINMVVQERNWVTVEGLNTKYITMGESQDFPGMMIKQEKPLLVTRDIKLVDPTDEKPAEVEWMYTEASERVRVSARFVMKLFYSFHSLYGG